MREDVSAALAPPARDSSPSANRIAWLVDNAETYRAMLRAIGRARRSIWITQLAFDADCLVYDRASTHDQDAPGSSLLAALVGASARVPVRIILNESLLLDTATPLRAALRRAGAVDVRVRGIKRFPQLLHAKMVIIDEREALLLGSPFVNGYWDHAGHPPSDSRRGDRELGGRPLHDVSMSIAGPAVHALSAIFAELWNDVSVGDADDAPIECRPRNGGVTDASVRIARTAPPRERRHPETGHTEILTAIERALGSARRFVYIEHQYLSSRRVIDALSAALRREPSLEVVVVVNQNPDVTAYRSWQNARLRESGLLWHPRVGIFALWRAAPAATDSARWDVNQLFVHSKVLIVDDTWLTTGSANLDGVSLHSYGHDFSGWLGRRIFRDVRNFDVNVILASDDHDACSETVRTLRTRLWAEHLTMRASALMPARAGGWLPLWRTRAAESVATLNAHPHHDAGSVALVLPYSTMPTPRLQLRDAGIREVERLDVRFDPGWLEVHFSPSWVRNMFA